MRAGQQRRGTRRKQGTGAMARERLASLRSSPGRRRGTRLSAGRPWVLMCCWLLAFLMNGGGSGNGGNAEPGNARLWSGGAYAVDVTADLAQPPGDNNLGRLAQACSTFCHAGVDGLDLWISFKGVSVSVRTNIHIYIYMLRAIDMLAGCSYS